MESTLFACVKCNYTTKYKQNYNKHVNSKKHSEYKETTDKHFECKFCKVLFLSKTTLWRHVKCCKKTTKNDGVNSTDEPGENPDACGFSTMFINLLKKEYIENPTNNEFIKKLEKLENNHFNMNDENKKLIENITKVFVTTPHNITTNGNTINNNDDNSINIDNSINNNVGNSINNNVTNNYNNENNVAVFLNTKCNDAINFIDFIDKIDVKIKDIQTLKNSYYTDTICNIINTQLKDYDIHERPVHCHFNNETQNNEYHIRDKNNWKTGMDEVTNILYSGIQKLDNNIFDKIIQIENLTMTVLNDVKNKVKYNGTTPTGKPLKTIYIIEHITKNANITDMVV
jgi:hypothetical protein